MTVSAYIVEKEYYYDSKTKKMWICKNIIEELFNVTRNPNVFNVIAIWGDDCTNNDCCGEMTLDREQWDKIKDEYSIDKKLNKVINDNKEIFIKIDEYLYWNEILELDCL